MDGDLVFDNETKQPRKISGTNDLLFHDDYDPIPLDEKILLKSGFTKDDNGNYEINDSIVIVMDWRGESEHFACAPYEVENCFGQYYYLYIELFECKYVHQLQHILSLCAINKEIKL